MSNLATIEQTWSPSQLKLIQDQIAKDCSQEEIEYFSQICQSTGLNPFSRQIYAIKRGGKNPRMVIQVGIDGFRSLAESTGHYGGSQTYWCGSDGMWHEVWLSNEKPAAAKTVCFRSDAAQPFVGIALWAEMSQWETVWANGRATDEKKLASLWAQMPAHMLGKVSEAHALRKAFPAKLSGLYTSDEIGEEPVNATLVSDESTESHKRLMASTSQQFKSLGWDQALCVEFIEKNFGGIKNRKDLSTDQLQQLSAMLTDLS